MHNEAMKMAKHAMTDACAKGYDCMTSQDWDDLKDCVETAKNAIECDYYYRLVERMKKDDEEEKREDAYFLDMLKEEYKDDYKRMKDEYGEDEGERRFYDNYRYKTTGRFAPKGRGSYMPRSSGRRGYEEPPYYMTPEMYRDYDPEYWRDMDRMNGKMYYTDGNMGGNMSNSGNRTANMSGGNRGYSDGYNDGQTRGYSEGYERGMNDGRKNSSSRYEKAKRGYEETKAMHKGNTPEDKQLTMREAEKMLNVVFDEIDEMLEDAPVEMKNMVKTKGISRFQKIS